MEPLEIGRAYNRITERWERENFDYSNGIEQHKRAIAFLKNKGKALDVGCGSTGRFMDLLLGDGLTPEGVDVSEEMITQARKRHPEQMFYLQDICTWDIPERYDFITAWDSIWHIPLNQQKTVLTKLISSLKKNGVFIFSFGGTDEVGKHVDNTMGPEVYYSTLGVAGFVRLIIDLDCTVRHLEYDQYPELHSYVIAQKLN